jgi:hypothetical protein
MPGFDDVSRQFQPKPGLVRLECENCGQSPDGVQTLRPCWFNDQQDVRLCIPCSALGVPTDPALIAQRNAALHAAGYSIVSSSMACLAVGLLLAQW